MISDSSLDAKIQDLLNLLYTKRFNALEGLSLEDLMKKNPYLYRSVGLNDAAQLIEQILIARISSSDETIFGNDFFEPLALWAAQQAATSFPNRVVTVGAGAGQDISIEDDFQFLAISVKSGTNILNAQSAKGQSHEFVALNKRLQKVKKQFRAIVGHGYGRSTPRAASSTEKIAGQKFWFTLTGEEDFYIRIARSIGKFSGKHREEYSEAFTLKKNLLTIRFSLNFVDPSSGVIDWDKIVQFNSSESRPPKLAALPDANAGQVPEAETAEENEAPAFFSAVAKPSTIN